jgi:hypothetical protein
LNVWLLVLSAFFTQLLTPAQAQENPNFNEVELQQMLAPVALYPDALLSQVLMAASYPLEVVEAQRWISENPTLAGSSAVHQADQADWDSSVKSLVAFPAILQTMSTNLQWTQRLGQASVLQQPQVMYAVQVLRHRAYAAGNLTSNIQVQVVLSGSDIIIEPANSQVFYVPYYNPVGIYGNWWWPQYPPVTLAPNPAYGYSLGTGLQWGNAIFLDADYFFGKIFWVERLIYVRPFTAHDQDHHAHDRDWGKWGHDDRPRPYRAVPLPRLRSITATQVLRPMMGHDARDTQSSQPSATQANKNKEQMPVITSSQVREHQKLQTSTATPTQATPKPQETERKHDHDQPEVCVKGPCALEKDSVHDKSANGKSRP